MCVLYLFYTYLPAFVTIISVPREWNSSHKLFISKSTRAFMSPGHNGLTFAWEHEDCVGGGLELGERPLSLPSSESSGISWLSAPLKGVLFPVPAFMRRSVKQITKDRRQWTFKKTAGYANSKGLSSMIDDMRYELRVSDINEVAQIDPARKTHNTHFCIIPSISLSRTWEFQW